MARRPRNNNNGEKRYIGVRKRAPGRYGAEVYERFSRKSHWLGTFDTALEAALAYDKASRQLNGLRAKTNFPVAFDVPEDDDDGTITFAEFFQWLVFGHDEPMPPSQVDLELRLGQPRQAAAGVVDHRTQRRI